MHIWRHREGAHREGKIQDAREREDDRSLKIPQEVIRESIVSPGNGDGF